MKRPFNLSLGLCKLKPQSDSITHTLVLLKCKRVKQVWWGQGKLELSYTTDDSLNWYKHSKSIWHI